MKSPKFDHGQCCTSISRSCQVADAVRFACAIAIALLAALLAGSHAALAQTTSNPAPVQTFYVPADEDDALASLETINQMANAPMYSYVSIAIGTSGTYVYYDQWELSLIHI